MDQETTSKRNQSKDFFPVLTVLFYLLTAFGTVFAYYIADNLKKNIAHYLVAAFVLTTFFLFFLVTQCKGQFRTLAECGILAACYAVVYLFIILSVRYSTLFFLSIGPVLAAMLFSFPIGFLLEVVAGILFCLFCGYAPEQALVLFLSGSMICMVSRFFKKRSTYQYGLIVVVSAHITLMVIMNRFVLFRSIGNGVIYSALCCVVTVGICNSLYSYLRIYIKIKSAEETFITVQREKVPSAISREETVSIPSEQMVPLTIDAVKSLPEAQKPAIEPQKIMTEPLKQSELKNEMEQALDRIFPQQEDKKWIADSVPESKLNDVRFQLIKVLFPENILMEQLRDRSPRLFLHSQKIGNISYDAAKTIGANSLLAKAGGYYHEIGRLHEGNYITEGIRLAEEQHFPDSVIQIIRQHNVKISHPTSPEAAIVMLTDSIVSTEEYVKHAPENKRVSIDKIISNIFAVRMKNGTLDEAGITPDQIQVLTKFYLSYFEHVSGKAKG